MRELREALDFCGFRDFGFVGTPFTWCTNQFEGEVIWIRLDRGVATPNWIQLFPTVCIHHIGGTLSDHCPLWLCSDDENVRFYKKSRPFRSEAVWLKDEACEGVIKRAWNDHNYGNPVGRLIGKVEACRSSLQKWSRLSFGNIRRMLKQKRKKLVQAESMSMAGNNHDQVRVLRREVPELMVKEEGLRHQRSRSEWLKSGDMNTSYFHSRATQRNKRNFISKLLLEDGTMVTDDKQIGDKLVEYFKQIFTSSSPTNFDQILQGIDIKVTLSMNFDLTREFTTDEVEFALKQMKPLTAPSPDGMSPIFFKFCWQFIGQGIIDASLAILNSGNISANLNHTYIALIPKTKSLERATDFRPISLCNVLYKIESKTIANRLKKIMPKLVSESQSAFMLDRLITDNILVAHETLHHLKTKKNKKNKKTRKTGYMAIKLDMSKAYDKAEWVFLEKSHEKNGL